MRKCPTKSCHSTLDVRKKGHYFRKSDSKWIRRYHCSKCGKHFSNATFSESYGQNKRRLNPIIFNLLNSGMSQRRTAKVLRINLKTVARKLQFLDEWSIKRQKLLLKDINIYEMQFDEMETLEHSKLKPISLAIAVEKETRFIIGIRASIMPSKGLLKEKSLKKYGKREDHRKKGLEDLFFPIRDKAIRLAESDECPRYPRILKKYFPEVHHKRYKGRRGCVTGQGEMKSGGFDPLFSINHSCAMVRASVNRLFRRSWCTTKSLDRLQMHLNLYVYYHNSRLI